MSNHTSLGLVPLLMFVFVGICRDLIEELNPIIKEALERRPEVRPYSCLLPLPLLSFHYEIIAHEAERDNCFSKIQLVGQ